MCHTPRTHTHTEHEYTIHSSFTRTVHSPSLSFTAAAAAVSDVRALTFAVVASRKRRSRTLSRAHNELWAF